MKKLLVAMVAAVALVGCGGPDNVGACKKFLSAAKCGTVDISSAFSCDTFQNANCDLTPYFDCAASHYVCSNGSYDSTKMSSFATDCAAKATCR